MKLAICCILVALMVIGGCAKETFIHDVTPCGEDPSCCLEISDEMNCTTQVVDGITMKKCLFVVTNNCDKDLEDVTITPR